MESKLTRQLSQSLFHQLKPHCLQVSELALSSPIADINTLTYELRQILITLATHYNQHLKQDTTCDLDTYIISTRLADYVFFPLSNLLKQQLLPETVVQYILEILAFSIAHSWSHDVDEKLVDELFPLVVFLARDKATSTINNSFNSAVISCMVSLVKCIPRDYYIQKDALQKRLWLLGNSTTLLLGLLETRDTSSEDQIRSILHVFTWLYSTRVTAEQTSLVFPGIVSNVINFHSKSKNLSPESLLAILIFLKTLIVKVFSDTDLGISVTDDLEMSKDLLDLSAFLESLERAGNSGKVDYFPVTLSLLNSENSPGSYRSGAWLSATAKQLKISLLIFMKNLILGPNSRTKIVSNPKLYDEIFGFVTEISRSCFKALFKEVIPSTFDILSALFYVTDNDLSEAMEQLFLTKLDSVYLMHGRSDLELLYMQISVKTESLVSSQLSHVLLFSSEEKICLCLSAIKVHLYVVVSLKNVLLKSHETLDSLVHNILRTLVSTMTLVSSQARDKGKLGDSKRELLQRLGGLNPADYNAKSNAIDDIELPAYVDAKKLGIVTNKKSSLAPVANTRIVKSLDLDFNNDQNDPYLFGRHFSKRSEKMIQSFTSFIGLYCSTHKDSIISSLFLENDTDHNDEFSLLLQRTISIWLSNSLYKNSPTSVGDSNLVKIEEFLKFSEDSDEEFPELIADEETGYLILQSAQDLLDDTKTLMNKVEINGGSTAYNICETAYTVALRSMGLLASRLSKDDFQADVLMQYLYPLLEALTYAPASPVYMQARVSLSQIVFVHYAGSMASLIKDNSDYLIDSLSADLLVASGLKPSLPGVLLVVVRICGVDLLLLNQLQDIISEIFIVIDSFHGYSTLVENFFHVFEVIISKVMELYGTKLADITKVILSHNLSPYKPWGLVERREMLRLVDDAHKSVDIFADHDPEKEYFQRKPGVPFGDQTGDSDDEEDEETVDEQQEPEQIWPSPVQQNIYSSVHQIFTYGLQLFSHPSVKLRLQILHTLKKAYPIMSSNYEFLLPTLAHYWPLLLILSTGSGNFFCQKSTVNSHENQLIAPALELMIMIFEEDAKHENFMASRFIDMWEVMKRKVLAISLILEAGSLPISHALVLSPVHREMSALYSRLLLRGINTYEKAIPDLVAHEMVRVCYSLGIDEKEYIGRDVANHLWVVSNMRQTQ